MKKALFFALFTLIFLSSSFSQTAKWEIFELGAHADIIVSGKISLLESKSFTVKIDQVLAGNYSEPTIVVQKFHNTKTAKRWGKYIQGEEVMLWLKSDAGLNKIVGENGEGEKLIFNNEIFLDSRGGALKNTFGNQAVYPGLNNYAEKVNAKEFAEAVKDTKACFSLEIEEKKSPEGLVVFKRFAIKKLEDKAYDEIRSKSWMHDLIIASGEKHLR